MSSFYLTTPIYYASGEPHIGHAYTTVLADALARYRRRRGDDVLFVTGTDEHGQKIQEAAQEREMEPIELCDLMARSFGRAWTELGISNDRFIRTTEPEHGRVVAALLERLRSEDLLYESDYVGWYSVGQERYFTEKEVGPERVDPIAKGPVQKIRETNCFFRMSRFQDRLARHIRDCPGWIVPESRRNEVLGFLSQPLEDLSVSRPRSRIHWGIPLPWDPEQVTYVWVDALANYVTAGGGVDPDAPAGKRGFSAPLANSRWPADLHVVGKDILTTHAVYWPTLLMGAGLELPKKILAHGWWLMDRNKMSKSLGNVVDPLALRAEYGTDALRWYLMREMNVGQDAVFARERFLARYAELSNVVGNLLHRVSSMVIRYRSGIVPPGPGRSLDEEIGRAVERYERAMEDLEPHRAFAAAMDLARTANVYIEAVQPWKLARARGAGKQLDAALNSLSRALCVLSCLLEPAIPEAARSMARRMGLALPPAFGELGRLDPAGATVRMASPLFPRISEKDS